MSINVLVYNGPGVSQTSVGHTIHSLRTLLRPNYSVNTITPQALTDDPWPASCALLVIPGGRDMPYVSALEKANPRIKEYVKRGGSFLGICAGGYYGSAHVEWEVGTPLEVIGDRALAFFPGTAKGCAFEGFVYESEAGARAIDVQVNAAETPRTFKGIYYNGGGYFENAETLQSKGIRVLSVYTEGLAKGKAAAVACDVGAGRAILMGPHMEYPITLEPAAAALKRSYPDINDSEIAELERARWDMMKTMLELLGLHSPYKTSEDVPSRSPGPLPQVLVSTPSNPSIVSRYLDVLRSICPHETPNRLQDANDTFNFHPSANFTSILARSRERRVAEEDLGLLERDIVIYEGGCVPTNDQTPLFNLETFFNHLSSMRSSLSLRDKGDGWGMGEALLYGEIITSTQTLFDKNPTLLSALPYPTLSLASHQLSGRGRGSNIWLSPSGCLQFSLLLRPPQGFRSTSLVFIQYLFGLAVVEACRKAMPGNSGEQVRLKWPNDVYAAIKNESTGKEELKKLGGILVTTNFSGGLVDVVIGCGINVLNPLPTTSLSQLVPPGTQSELTMEKTIATIMPVFEQMWDTFLSHGSFEPFMDLYLTRWLHSYVPRPLQPSIAPQTEWPDSCGSDQLVTLTTVTPHQAVRIVGITSDYGLLRTLPERGGAGAPFIDLQPDGNSFDMMAGLIKLKR
ncbi:biotin holocarboxylase synthetase [Tulasnella sp. 424]|nr:biotin holocarboxylase synthetase [Tulasnella sp. 424]